MLLMQMQHKGFCEHNQSMELDFFDIQCKLGTDSGRCECVFVSEQSFKE